MNELTRFERIYEDEIAEVRDNVDLSPEQFRKLVKVVSVLPEICENEDIRFEDHDLFEIFERAALSYDSYNMDLDSRTGQTRHLVTLEKSVANAVNSHFNGADVKISFPK